jgi:TIR domain
MSARPVFVSYSQPDRDVALAIVSQLEGNEVQCWVAPRDVRPGSEWAEQIVEAIARAAAMVLVFSTSANASPQVRREVERAVHRRVPVLPFRVEDVMPSRSLEYFLSSQHWLDAFPPPMEPHYARLTAYVKALLAGMSDAAEAGSAAASAVPEQASLAERTPAVEMTPAPERALPTVVFDPGDLARLEAELARFIGPVARHLVNRARLRSSGVEELLTRLGSEIDSDTERRAFLEAARQSLRLR